MTASPRLLRYLLVLTLGPLLSLPVGANEDDRPFLAPVFGDHMVLQRDRPNTFWGWARPDERVTVEVGGRTVTGHASADGRWELLIPPPPAGGPYRVRISGPQVVELNDVLVGDVWLCSGQSNMQFSLEDAEGGKDVVAAANLPGIRLFRVPSTVAYAAAETVRAGWSVSTPEHAARFSAVGFLFGRQLHEALSVPIGLVQAAVGGSPAESWMSPAALEPFPEFREALAEIARLRERGVTPNGSFLMHWLDDYDVGLQGETWAAPGLDESDWREVPVPGGFAEFGVGEVPAIVWFRRVVVLPDPLPPGEARLQLGVVEKMDTAFINGRWVGASSWVENPRNYAVPADVLRPGPNTVAVRVFKLRPDGGFQSPPDQLRLVLGDGTVVPLAGAWRARLSLDARPPHPLPLGYENYPTMPTVLQQGMLAPLAPLTLTGVIWYQGEANFTRAYQYRELLPALIADWRQLFRQPDFPFYIVSLPAFMARRDQPGTDGWAELREAQALAAARVANTAVALTLDTGDAADIHPREKRPAAERLARLALDEHYRRPVESRGPRLAAVERRPGALVIHFVNTGEGLQVRGDAPEFAIAGRDGRWHPAEVTVERHTVILRSSAVPQPVDARYAWQANPRATLYNSAGLPAEPFRTDQQPWSTAPRN